MHGDETWSRFYFKRVIVKSEDGQLIPLCELTHFPSSLQDNVSYLEAPYWICPVGVEMIAVISQLVEIYRFCFCFAFPTTKLRVVFFISFFFLTARQKSRLSDSEWQTWRSRYWNSAPLPFCQLNFHPLWIRGLMMPIKSQNDFFCIFVSGKKWYIIL